jgi:hypothetical protein
MFLSLFYSFRVSDWKSGGRILSKLRGGDKATRTDWAGSGYGGIGELGLSWYQLHAGSMNFVVFEYL